MTLDDAAALAAEIRAFLDAHAKSAAAYDPNYDPPDERFNGPDPVTLLMAAVSLEAGETPRPAWSDWSSGCYRPHGDREARALHDRLVQAVRRAHEEGVEPAPAPRV